jgi:hypothetical protein
MPVAGSDCLGDGQACGYPGCEGPTSSTATCVGGQWLVHYSSGPACNPPAVIPVCPERPIVNLSRCAYDEQLCSNEPCNGAEVRSGFVCATDIWLGVMLSCPTPAVDAGAAPGGDAGP